MWHGAMTRRGRRGSSRSATRGGPAGRPRRGRGAGIALAAAILAAVGVGGCGTQGAGDAAGSGRIEVVAAENFWGSIATQLGGTQASVRSIVVDPASDPHGYEPTAGDARALAGARLAIVNGLGYDGWAGRLLAANPVAGRVTLDVGRTLGLGEGANPHQWYSPASVRRVAAAITAAYQRLEPAQAGYFAQRRREFEGRGLAEYDRLRAEIGARYGGVPVGYSESLFRPLGEDLGLKLATPYGFARAISEGTDVSAQDKRTVDRQVEGREIAVWVYNSQNLTPDVQRVNELARARGVAIVTVTETLSPASASFEQWQVGQLRRLERALQGATGR